MTHVYKYQLAVENECRVQMPRGARLLTMQYGALMLWAEVDTTAPRVTRVLYVRGTGHPMREAEGCPHVGTVFLSDDRLVLHVFDGGEAQ